MKCQNIYISRHGVRPTQLPSWAEPSSESYEGPGYDAPLAPLGRQQAEALAERMRDVPLDYIFASPFRRTIQSVVPLARMKNIPIFLEGCIGELLLADWFTETPELPSSQERHGEFPEVDPEYRSQITPQYPETREMLYERIRNGVHFLAKNFGANIFLMGHGASSLAVRKVLIDPDLAYNVDFCALSQITFQNGKWESVLDGDISHLLAKGAYVGSQSL